jgi:diguanylate cyclase (GGDEF)-like protein
MFREIAPLVAPARHPTLLNRRRAEAIGRRVQAFSVLFAVLTLAWIAVDALVIGPPWWTGLAVARIVASLAFAALALACARCTPTIGRARIAVAVLFAIPVTFFIVAQLVLGDAKLIGMAMGVGAAYAFVPFLLACGIAAFPLTAAEALLLLTLPFAAEAWLLGIHKEPLPDFMALDAFWLLALLACVSSFAAMSQVKLMMELVRTAIRDPLTGCLRRESGMEMLEMQLALAMRRHAPLSVLFADLDRFKAVNDEFGHEVGDSVLATAAEALREVTRESDAVIRWGGEEFLMVLHDATREDAILCIERLRAHGAGRLPDGRRVTLSIGVAEVLKDGEPDAHALVALADRRMYAAKQAGRNRYVFAARSEAIPILSENSTVSR